mgnify:CR=1 FL=1
MDMNIKLDNNLDTNIKKLKEICNLVTDIDNRMLTLQFISIKEFSKLTGWSQTTVQDLYNRPDFPSTNFGKEKKAEIHAIIEYFKVPRRR